MKDSRLTVAEIIRSHLRDFLKEFESRLPQYIVFALMCIERCRTAALGAKRYQCQYCGHESLVYNSCRHRACPQCENQASAKWMEARAKDLLPVHYFHVVFTLPHLFNELVMRNQRLCLSLFFTAVQKTLLTVGRNNLKAKVGFFCILHTWGQKLDLHNHIHCVIPGGGISLDGLHWIHSSKNRRYFVSHKVLALVFRGIFIRALKKAQRQGKLVFEENFERFLDESCWKKWCVYCESPFSNPTNVLKYLSCYVRKIAISNARLISLKDGTVKFSYTDYADGAKKKCLSLRAVEFIRRFIQHIPPPSFVRIRHCGFLANAKRKTYIAMCREFLCKKLPDYASLYRKSIALGSCPLCKIGTLKLLAIMAPLKVFTTDSS